MIKKGLPLIWSVELACHSLLFQKPVVFDPWCFDSQPKAQDFVYRLFAPPLVEWARVRLLEWPTGCVDPPDVDRLELLRDPRMLRQLHDFYCAEKEKTGMNYWTWTINPMQLRVESKSAAESFLENWGKEFSDFQ
jgi:hypothetical protein